MSAFQGLLAVGGGGFGEGREGVGGVSALGEGDEVDPEEGVEVVRGREGVGVAGGVGLAGGEGRPGHFANKKYKE